MEKMTSLDRMKKENEKSILRAVYETPGIYRKLIAAKTGLSSQTVTNLVTEMLEKSMLVEYAVSSGARGRTPLSLRLNYAGFYLITAEVTVQYLFVCIHSLDEKEAASGKRKLQGGEDVLQCLKDLLDGVCGQAAQIKRVQALVVSVAGLVNEDIGTVVQAEKLRWYNLNLQEELAYLGVPVLVRNDVNLIACYEKTQHQGDMNFMVVKLDAGIGASFVLGSRVLRTANNAVGELGHVTVVSGEERVCACGKTNCLTRFISCDALEKTYGKPYDRLVQDVREARTEAIQMVEKICDYLAPVLANVITLLDLDRVILCGCSADQFQDILYPCLDQRIRRLLSYWVSFKGLEIHRHTEMAGISTCFWLDTFFASNDGQFVTEGNWRQTGCQEG